MRPIVNAKALVAAVCAVALACCLAGCADESAEEPTAPTAQPSTGQPATASSASEQAAPSTEPAPKEDEPMQVRTIEVAANGVSVTFELNDSAAATALCDQLPLAVEVSDFSTNEKVFYPPEPLDATDAPHAEGGAGTLAYYEPWGDVVMFYDGYSPNDNLFELGRAVSGVEHIEILSGAIDVAPVA